MNCLLLLFIFIYNLSFSTEMRAVKRKPLFRFTTSDYDKILKTTAFVDKTLMIRKIVENPEVLLITAPPRFGKSTNLDMLKKFLEIEVDEEGGLITRANLTNEPVQDTANYKLFVENSLKITENNTIMDEYFGKTPVIFASFKCLNVIRTYEEAEVFCKNVIHDTFKQHKYLLHSERLTHSQKTMFERWFNDSTYTDMSKHHIAHGLRVLSVYLYRHFNKRRVFVVIDDHDSVIEKAMFDVEGAEVLRKIIALSVSTMSTAVKNNEIYVKGGLICGISDIPVFGFSDLNKVTTYRFLDHHHFHDYYGLTQTEADELFLKSEFGLDPNAIKQARLAYNGYQNEKENKIYNIYSVLRFLKTGDVANYWSKFGTIKKLRNVFKIPAFKHYVEKLADGKCISITILEKLTVEDVIDLRNLLLQPQTQINYWPSILFNYLFKQGYLTYTSSSRPSSGSFVKQSTVKLPNTEVIDLFKKLK